MLDSATGIGALAALSPDLTVVTRSLDTRFLKPSAVGAITERRASSNGRIAIWSCRPSLVDANGITVADATARLRILATK